jgi:Fe-S cluster assembly iron-binding protein IscA
MLQIHISELASAKLKALLWQESSSEPLAFRVVPLTSGCSTPSFALELSEVGSQALTRYADVPFLDQSAHPWLDGLVIDVERANGKLSIAHPNPAFLVDCGLATRL